MGQVIASIAAFFSGEVLSFGGAEAARFLRGGMVLALGLWRFYGAPGCDSSDALRERRAVCDAGVPMGLPGAQRVLFC